MLSRWVGLIEEDAPTDPPLHDRDEAAQFARTAIREIRESGGVADLVLLSGARAIDFDLYRALEYNQPRLIRGSEVGDAISGSGTIDGVPVYQAAAAGSSSRLSVVDLNDFELERFPPAPNETHDIIVSVDEITEEDAIERLESHPEWRETLRLSDEPGRELSLEDGVVRLQLRVVLEVLAAGTINAHPSPRTQSAHLDSAGTETS